MKEKKLLEESHKICSNSWFLIHWIYDLIKNHLISEDLDIHVYEMQGIAQAQPRGSVWSALLWAFGLLSCDLHNSVPSWELSRVNPLWTYRVSWMTAHLKSWIYCWWWFLTQSCTICITFSYEANTVK